MLTPTQQDIDIPHCGQTTADNVADHVTSSCVPLPLHKNTDATI